MYIPAISSVDQFIRAKLEAHQLAQATSASPATYLRRLSLVLIGLPPSEDEVLAFERDCQAAAVSGSERDAYVAGRRRVLGLFPAARPHGCKHGERRRVVDAMAAHARVGVHPRRACVASRAGGQPLTRPDALAGARQSA